MSTLIATKTIADEDVTAGKTRVAEDHELTRRYPDAFKRDAYSDSMWRGRGLPRVNGQPTTEARSAEARSTELLDPISEQRLRDQRVAEIQASAARNERTRRVEHERRFWRATARLLERIDDPDGTKARERRRHEEWIETLKAAEAARFEPVIAEASWVEDELNRRRRWKV